MLSGMPAGRTNRAEQLIYQHRAQEQKLSDMRTKLKQEFHQQEFAKWQNKGKNIEMEQQVQHRLAGMRQQAHHNLQRRRAQLAQLLEQEDRQFKEEILAMQETPEQTRARMAQRVQELKQQREQQRSQEVNAKLERRFEMNADELRQVDQGIKE